MYAALTRPLFGSPPASLLLVPFGLCTIGAAVFLPVGAKQKADAAAMNPAEDFAVSGTQCQVTAAKLGERQTWSSGGGTQSNTQSDKYKCYDWQQYDFTHDGAAYTSMRLEKLRSSGKTGYCSRDKRRQEYSKEQTPAEFKGDQKYKGPYPEGVTCWEPTSTPVNSRYKCGNEKCIKIFDPADDKGALAKDADNFVYAGIACAAVAAVFGLCGSVWHFRNPDAKGCCSS